MKKLLLALFVTSVSFSQELIKEFNFKLPKNSDVFQVVEEDKKQISLFFSDKNYARTLRFDDNFNLIDSLKAQRPSKLYYDIIGYSISGNKYYSYWSNLNSKEIASQCFDFDSKSTNIKSYRLEFEKEKPIKKITINNVFYLITVVKNTSILNVYVFNDGQMEKKSIDLSDKTFLDYESKKTNLWEIVNEYTSFEPALTIQNIVNETPPSLTFSANKRKAYTKDNNLILTFDNNQNFTQLLNINLSNFSCFQKLYNQPFMVQSEFSSFDSNSFLLNNKIIQMKINSSKMAMTIKDLEGNELKNFEIITDQEIDFKNSEIIQENGKISNTRILEKSSQLLRKIYNLNPSIACFENDNNIYMTIGGVSTLQNNSAAMYGGMIGGLTGALIGAAISSNYSVNNLNSYTNRKVVYINCLFDNNFNHIKGTIKKLAFDELRSFAEEKSNLTSQTVFRFNSNLYFGGFNHKNSNYSFYKFQN
ncbi:hypothetical protein [Flavobacterium sp.]|uniref:hypothetical protein n=1 Tax=Flavobacterium sp. TaxID=239 RepID=UPI00261B4A35|nr:hypothetical protein [Flavobacterium sp.]